MIREKANLFRKLAMTTDAVVISIAFILTHYLRQNIHHFYKFDLISSQRVMTNIYSLDTYLWLLLFIIPLWVISLYANGIYGYMRVRRLSATLWMVVKSAFWAILFFGVFVFALKIGYVSRAFISLFTFLGIFLLCLEKVVFIEIMRYVRRRDYNYRNMLVAGTGGKAEQLIGLVKSHPEWGIKVTGLLDWDGHNLGKVIMGAKVIGLVDDIADVLHNEVIDDVVFVVPREELHRIDKPILSCEVEGIRASIAMDLFNLNFARGQVNELGGFPLLTFGTTRGQEWELLLKKVLDKVASALGLVLLSPLFLVTALGIKLTSKGPVFFKQDRCGLNGRIFQLYKFRSMVDGAEAKRGDLEEQNEMSGPVFKVRNDPRITPFGRFLRRFSIDELPQLINVIRGEMSLVGPRPPIPGEVEKYEMWQRRRLSMRPGITCIWQVSGRNEVDFGDWMQQDMRYIDNWSLGLDFRLLMKTIPTVVLGNGAR